LSTSTFVATSFQYAYPSDGGGWILSDSGQLVEGITNFIAVYFTDGVDGTTFPITYAESDDWYGGGITSRTLSSEDISRGFHILTLTPKADWLTEGLEQLRISFGGGNFLFPVVDAFNAGGLAVFIWSGSSPVSMAWTQYSKPNVNEGDFLSFNVYTKENSGKYNFTVSGLQRDDFTGRLPSLAKVCLRTMPAALASPTSLARHTSSKRLSVG